MYLIAGSKDLFRKKVARKTGGFSEIWVSLAIFTGPRSKFIQNGLVIQKKIYGWLLKLTVKNKMRAIVQLFY